jgi:hypothetical protein
MLLRKLSLHIRDQQWFAVGLDLLIVVIGVFIGIQVANWNDARKDAVLHETLLARVAADFRALEPVVAEQVAFAQKSRQSTAEVIEALRHQSPPADDAAFRAALARANWAQNIPQLATSYRELVATGRLTDIRELPLRNALIRYGDAHERLERIYPVAAGVILSPASNYYRAVDWNMDPGSWQDERAIVSYDWQALRASRAEMQSWVSYQHDLARYAADELEAIRAVVALLDVDSR